MKQMVNKSLVLEGAAEELNNYADLAKLVISSKPEGGYDLETMELRLKIRKKLDKSTTHIVLEDAEAAELQKAEKLFKWGALDEQLVDFCKEVRSMSDAKNDKAKGK